MSAAELGSGLAPTKPSVISVCISIPERGVSSRTSNISPTFEESKTKWLSAFRQCSQFTLRSMSFLTHAGGHLDHGPDVDLELDTHQSVLAIMASGLPLPKSPSVQLDEMSLGESSDARQQEREERGWWSLRFQQVLREMQRRDAIPPLDYSSMLSK